MTWEDFLPIQPQPMESEGFIDYTWPIRFILEFGSRF
jgi:hypothetical protein